MNITYDPVYNIAYIRLRDKTADVISVAIGERAHIDISPEGKIYGIELLDANEQLLQEGTISLTDESTGRAFVLPLVL